MTTELDIPKLRAQYEAATPGDWAFDPDFEPEEEPIIWSDAGLNLATIETGAAKDEDEIVANATLIVTMHNTYAALLDRAEQADRAEAVVEAARLRRGCVTPNESHEADMAIDAALLAYDFPERYGPNAEHIQHARSWQQDLP